MRRDLNQSLGDIHANESALRKEIWEVQHHLISNTKAQHWAKRLRFITNGDKPIEEEFDQSADAASKNSTSDISESGAIIGSDEESALYCDCGRKRPFANKQGQDVTHESLTLTAAGDLQDCNHYVAISYRWPSRSDVLDTFYKVHTGTNAPPRSNRAPRNVLERAIAFAEFHNYKLIWIDQECIDQNDRQDKEFGIQSMDQVFQNAAMSVALLTGTVQEQRHLDALFDLIDHREDMSREEVISMLEVLEIILGDEWHSRAWCFQEISVSIQQMTFLIPRNPSIVPKQDLAKYGCRVPNEIEMDASELFNSVANIFAYEANYPDLLDEMEKISKMTTSIAASGQRTSTQMGRYEFNAAQAIRYLHDKKHSRTPDALAILANLCNYSLRLNTLTLDAHEKDHAVSLSLSVCIYTLSISNGDLSLLFSTNEHEGPKVADSWIPNLTARLDNVPYVDLLTPVILKKSKIKEVGLEVLGILWLVDERIALDAVQSQFASQWQAIDPDLTHLSSKPLPLPPADTKLLRSLELKVLRGILHQLHSYGQIQLAHTLWGVIRTPAYPRLSLNSSEKQELMEYKEIFGDLKWLDLANCVEDGAKCMWHINRTASKWIARRCLRDRFILAGSPVNNSKASNVSTCLFDIDAPSIILSPIQQPGDNLKVEIYRLSFAMSWIVHANNQENCPLDVRGVASGIWSKGVTFDENLCQEYILK